MPKLKRIQLRISEELKRGMVKYAERHNISLSQLVTDTFVTLLKSERDQEMVDAEQV